jgi:hypothetical protein
VGCWASDGAGGGGAARRGRRSKLRVGSASRVRPCRLSPICRGRAALGHDVPGLAGGETTLGMRCDLASNPLSLQTLGLWPFRVEDSSQCIWLTRKQEQP